MLVVREFDEVGKLLREKHYYCSNIKAEKRECKPNVRRRDHPLMGSVVSHPLLLSS